MNILYKYRAFNDYTCDIFKYQKVWLAKPCSLNDPFDCKAELYSDLLDGNYDRICKLGHLSNFMLMYDPKSPRRKNNPPPIIPNLKKIEKNIKVMSAFMKKGSVNKAFDLLQETMDKYLVFSTQLTTGKTIEASYNAMINNVGVFSLTSVPTSLLMWAHYANNHTGICIGFERSKNNKLGDSKKCMPINYVVDFPKVKIDEVGMQSSLTVGAPGQVEKKIQFNSTNPVVKRVLFTKSKEWSYEKEFRYVESEYGLKPLPGKITEVIFGYNCKGKVVNEIGRLLKKYIDNDVKLYRIMPSKNSFRLIMNHLSKKRGA